MAIRLVNEFRCFAVTIHVVQNSRVKISDCFAELKIDGPIGLVYEYDIIGGLVYLK